MALAIDGSSPAVVTAATKTLVTGSFTPPAGALLLALWAGNSTTSTNPGTPTIADSQTDIYTLNDWQSRANSPTVDGQAADWWAVATASTSMTVTSTSGVVASEFHQALGVRVITGAHATPIGAHGKSGSTSAGSIAQGFTATADGSWGFLAVCDWDALGSMTAGTGCTLIGTGTVPTTQISYGLLRRTTADGVNGATTTMNITLAGTSTHVSWTWVEVVPAASGITVIVTRQPDLFGPGPLGPTGRFGPVFFAAPVVTNTPADQTIGTGTANQPIAAVTVAADVATGTGTANAATEADAADPGAASGTGTANQPSHAATASAGAPAGTGTSNAAVQAVGALAGANSGTGTANAPSTAVKPNAGVASGTGTANQPAGAGSANAGAPAGTGTANGPTPAIAVSVDVASGTGTANQPTVTTSASGQAPAGLASGTGTANQPTTAATTPSQVAAGTGTAGAPSSAEAGLPPVASGTGVAGQPSSTHAGSPANAAASGSALDATVSTSAPGVALRASAGLAGGTGTAYPAVAGGQGRSRGWWGLISVLRDFRNRQYIADTWERQLESEITYPPPRDDTRPTISPPRACPHCGEPLRLGGPSSEWFCLFDGWTWDQIEGPVR